jgi:hypothetical protein
MYLKPRMTVLARPSSNLPNPTDHELVVNHFPFSKDVSMEADEYPLLGAAA